MPKYLDTAEAIASEVANGATSPRYLVSAAALRELVGQGAPAELSAIERTSAIMRTDDYPDGARLADLAAEVSVSPQHMGRILAELRRQGLVSVSGRARYTRYHAVPSTKGET